MRKIILSIVLVLSMVAGLGCSNQAEHKKAETVMVNIGVIIDNLMTAPNQDLTKLMFKADNQTHVGIEDPYSEAPSEYEVKRDEIYKEYFTAGGYKSFITQGYDIAYHYVCIGTGQESRVTGTQITRNKNVENKYDFTITSEYGLVGEDMSEIESTGYARYDENGKINEFVLDGQLHHELNKLAVDLDIIESLS